MHTPRKVEKKEARGTPSGLLCNDAYILLPNIAAVQT